MKINAAVATAPSAPFVLRQVELAEPRPDEVLVRIAGVGLCHTDLVARDQFIPIPLPAVLGHEGSGTVERVGRDVEGLHPGDSVVIAFSSCGACRQCRQGLPPYCASFPALNFAGTRPDGSTSLFCESAGVSSHFFGQSSFAEFCVVPARNCVAINDAALPVELLGPLGCGIQTGAGAVLRSMDCEAGTSIAVFGGGPVGLAAIMAARHRGCDPIVLVEPVAARREMALGLGATHVIDPAAGVVSEAIRAILPGGLDYALETSGREAVVDTAIAALASRGLLGLVGVPPRPESSFSANLASLITFGHRIHGIIEGDSNPRDFIPELVRLQREGAFPFEKLLRTYPLADINIAIADQAAGLCVKPVLIP